MSNLELFPDAALRPDDSARPQPNHHTDGLSPALSGDGRGAVRPGDARLDVGLQSAGRSDADPRPLFGGGQRAPGAGRADGGHVGPAGGRGPDGQPRFDQAVPSGGYLWWYVDALSDCGQWGLSIIAFVGSVFSPYYLFAQRGGRTPAADNHCALNVALYSRSAKRWSMTERGQRHCSRDEHHFTIGPSSLHWDGETLVISIDEVGMPIPQRIRGTVRIRPEQLFNFSTPLDAAGRHRWGPLAPQSRVEVDLQQPGQRWQGHAYLDSNEGDEPIAKAFTEWDWSRGQMKDGSTVVIYDTEPEALNGRLLALRFTTDGRVDHFEAPHSQRLPRTAWRISRRMRSDGPVKVLQQLEDTPFYQRAMLEASLLGERVPCFHETLNVPRLVSPVVQAMLPWRMPRRA